MNLSAEQLKALLEEVGTRIDHPLPEMRPVAIEMKDPLGRETNSKAVGWTRKVTADIVVEFYEWLKTLPDNAILKGFVWLEEADATQPMGTAKKEPKKPKKGPHGKFWQEMFLENVISRPEFKTLFGIPDNLKSWKEPLRWHFSSDSLTHVSPAMLITKLKEAGLTELADQIQKIADSLAPRPTLPKGMSFGPAAIRGIEAAKLKYASDPQAEVTITDDEQSDEDFIRENGLY